MLGIFHYVGGRGSQARLSRVFLKSYEKEGHDVTTGLGQVFPLQCDSQVQGVACLVHLDYAGVGGLLTTAVCSLRLLVLL